MALEITMPKLSDTMEEGTILKWKVKEGDRVDEGDIIAEVETDKAAMEMEAFEAGVIRALQVEEGETVAVGTVIAVLETGEKEEKPAPPKAKKEGEKKPRPPKEPEKKKEEEPAKAEEEAEKVEEPQEEAEEEKPSAEEKAPASTLDIIASPAARKLARDKRIDISRVRGTGPGGRIVAADVEKALEKGGMKPPGAASEKRKKSVKIRRIVAAKMVESWTTIPHFYVTTVVDMSEVIRFRKKLGVTINDLIVAAVAHGLREHPWVNSRWTDGEAVEEQKIDIALAVATDRGLYNPVIRDCGALSLKEISSRARDLGERAHSGRLEVGDMEGGTFTISNMGMLGVESFSAIITPPQAAVLAVGTVKGEAVVDDQGNPGVAPLVRLTLSADHRILDGADAADFLTTLKSYLEAPVTLTDNHSEETRS